MSLIVEDQDRIRTITLNRPEALNAFNEQLYDAAAEALIEANQSAYIAVVVITGAGRAFSAGWRCTGLLLTQISVTGKHGFMGFTDALLALDKPLIFVPSTGWALGIGATILLCRFCVDVDPGKTEMPFTSLGVCPRRVRRTPSRD
ncbi:MAG: enoyl-CoA hydratase/isomerase family protein [Marmoricola sp.]